MDLSETPMSSNPSFFHSELIVSTEIEYDTGAMVGDEVGGDTVEREAVERGPVGKEVAEGEGMETGADALVSAVFESSELEATGSSILGEQMVIVAVVVTVVIMGV
jgi:hypothetical protein